MNWTNESPIILYGAATIATQFYKYLCDFCNIIGFIDKRADEIDDMFSLPVYRIDSPLLSDACKEDILVIICVKNVFDHENIVTELINNGFKNILFMPVDNSIFQYTNLRDKENLRSIYKQLQDYDICLPVSIPSAVELREFKYTDAFYIKEHSDKRLVRIPAIFVHTDIGEGNEWFNVPIVSLFPHLDLFAHFAGEADADYSAYLDIFCMNVATQLGSFKITERWRENVINNRQMIYEKMRLMQEISPDFFLNQAVEATWNKNGYFNLNGGKHRAAFLLSRDSLLLPLIVSQEDYDAYANKNEVTKLIKEMALQNDFKASYWMPNPYLANIPFDMGLSIYRLFYRFIRWLARQLYFDKHGTWGTREIVVYNEGPKFFTDLLRVLGCYVYDNTNEENKIIDNLFHITKSERENLSYDIVLLTNESAITNQLTADYIGIFHNDIDSLSNYEEFEFTGMGSWFYNNANCYLSVARRKN